MSTLTQKMAETESLRARTPATSKQIEQAEIELGLTFAEDYREYLAAFGAASANGHEFTGICKSERLNVIAVTKEARAYAERPQNWYVVEEGNIDGILVWQSSSGEVYLCQGTHNPVRIAESLSEYFKY